MNRGDYMALMNRVVALEMAVVRLEAMLTLPFTPDPPKERPTLSLKKVTDAAPRL